MYLYCASERLRNIYFQDSKYICLYNRCGFLQLLMVWRYIHNIILTRHYNYDNPMRVSAASELNIFSFASSQYKTVISFIILLVLQILSLRNIYFQVSNNIRIHNTQSMHFPYKCIAWCYKRQTRQYMTCLTCTYKSPNVPTNF